VPGWGEEEEEEEEEERKEAVVLVNMGRTGLCERVLE
jgi:hypothetical protein